MSNKKYETITLYFNKQNPVEVDLYNKIKNSNEIGMNINGILKRILHSYFCKKKEVATQIPQSTSTEKKEQVTSDIEVGRQENLDIQINGTEDLGVNIFNEIRNGLK